MSGDVFGDAAEEHTPQRCMSAVSDDDEVSLVFLDQADELVCGVARQDDDLDGGAVLGRVRLDLAREATGLGGLDLAIFIDLPTVAP